jgi:hypothetical protein
MLGPDGAACRAFTRGLLSPRPVRVGVVRYVGRESNQIEEVEAGEIEDLDEVLTVYGDDAWESLVVPVLRDMTATLAAARARMRRASISKLLREKDPAFPRVPTRAILLATAAEWAAEQLQAWGVGSNSEFERGGTTALATYLAERSRHKRRCAVPGCDKPARRHPSVTCSERHKKALDRFVRFETAR